MDETHQLLPATPHKTVHPLPLQASCLVFQGQHRVAACKLLNDPEEHWWYGEVYASGLKTSHPAEFLASMHASNEGHFQLETGDVDRFMAMHKLLQMKNKRTIDQETYLVRTASQI
ncbi:hypothetical protein FS749_002862, partial [Ceratobasidium sp. UAMH 11750]